MVLESIPVYFLVLMSNEYMSEPFDKNQRILNDLPIQDLDVNGALEK